MKHKGKVFLVGAGPGDPGLITKYGAELIASSDVIVVDDLVNPALLRTSEPKKIIYVGKRGPGSPLGSFKRLAQPGINKLLIQLARQGHRVVRLKGGDPFVFGRGGEEMEALKKAGVSHEIIPGVSSATAVPAYAGIPVSDRRWSSQVTILTGQESKDLQTKTPGVDFSRLSQQGTLVVLMGVGGWASIQKKLLAAGWPAGKAVVAIESGTLPTQRVIHSVLGRSFLDFKKAKLVAPAVMVVGDVARLGKKLSWFMKEKPLLGKKIVVTRATHQSAEFSRALKEKGADVISCPAIVVKPFYANARLTQTLSQLKTGRSPDWIIFLSTNAVRVFAKVMGADKSILKKVSLCAVGPRTAETMREMGWTAKKVAKTYNSRGVLSVLGHLRGKKILIPRVQGAPQDLVAALRKKGALVEELDTYQTISAPRPSKEIKKIILEGVHVVTFTSSTTVRFFCAFFSKNDLKKIFKKATALSIGPMTTKTLRQWKIPQIIETRDSTAEGLIKTIIQKRNLL